jgi:D-sedoheptulose 7-phosphate isomerase
MNTTIASLLSESATLKATLAKDPVFVEALNQSAQRLADCAKSGGTIFACGNGGSTCDAMHLCEELVARYKRNRPGIKAMHFMDPGVLTCWGNDFSFDSAFSRYAETFCSSRDILVAISTSGNSKNVLAAVEAAKAKGTFVIGLAGKDGGKLKQLADLCVTVPSQATERVQEVHITCIHIWCELMETSLGLGS